MSEFIAFETFVLPSPINALQYGQDGATKAVAFLQYACNKIENYYAFRPLKQKISFGMIKDTQLYGTSSVSMGIAQELFDDCQEEKKAPCDAYVLANCGTDGIKVGIYIKNECGVHSIWDDKSKDVPSPNDFLESGDYIPSKKDKISEDEWGTAVLQDQLKLQHTMKLIKKELQQNNLINVQYYTFITGPIRNVYERSSYSKQQQMDLDAQSYFKLTPFQYYSSFYLEQKAEGLYENFATQSMYQNLKNANQIEKDKNIVFTFGMGQGSTQMGPFFMELGMNASLESLCDEFDKIFSVTINPFIDQLSLPDNATIALKSGFLLLFVNNCKFKQDLLQYSNMVKII